MLTLHNVTMHFLAFPVRSKILPDRSLKIERVKINDDGIYICRAENSVGFVEALVKLTVRCKYLLLRLLPCPGEDRPVFIFSYATMLTFPCAVPPNASGVIATSHIVASHITKVLLLPSFRQTLQIRFRENLQ